MERVHGPYKHKLRWRLVGVGADGRRVRRSFATEAEARDARRAIERRIGTRTVADSVTEFLAHRASVVRDSTLATDRYRLVAFFGLDGGDDIPLHELTAARAAELYAARCAAVRPDTHQGELALVRALFRWLVKEGRVAADPFAAVEPAGRKAAGKPQLRVNEARAFLAAGLAEGSPAGLACALTLITGARASEVSGRVARDVDDGGRVLWITESKTRAGVRQLVIPEVGDPSVPARLAALAAGRPGDAPLWGEPVTRYWLHYHVRRICELAGVPVVSPHGLRGTAATLARLNGAASAAVAGALGQAGDAVTRRHYLAPGADQSADAASAARWLERPR